METFVVMEFDLIQSYKSHHRELSDLMSGGKRDKIIKPLERKISQLDYEMLFLLVRTIQPGLIFEFSPFKGWSSSAILQAINLNKKGFLSSFDLKDKCSENIKKQFGDDLLRDWSFFEGDVKEYFEYIYITADMILIDCEHTYEFALAYIEKIFKPILNSDRKVWFYIHDICYYKLKKKCGGRSERRAVLNFLRENDIMFYTNGKGFKFFEKGTKYIQKLDEVTNVRKKLGIYRNKEAVIKEESAIVFCLN